MSTTTRLVFFVATIYTFFKIPVDTAGLCLYAISTMKRVLCMWQRVQHRSLPNLNVLLVNGEYVGFVYKPSDTKTDKNAWRIYRGLGDSAKFVGHHFSKTAAMTTLNRIFAGNMVTCNSVEIVFAEPLILPILA